MRLLNYIPGAVLLFFISCTHSTGDKYLGNYSAEQKGEPVFTIATNGKNTYIVRLINIKSSKDFIFKYNSDSKTLVSSSSNDTIVLDDKKNELRFTNEGGPKVFYKIK